MPCSKQFPTWKYGDSKESPRRRKLLCLCSYCSEERGVYGETSTDFCAIISSALNDVKNYSASSSQLFICRAECYKRLTKFKHAFDNLREATRGMETVYQRKNPGTKRLRSEEDLENVEVIDEQQTTPHGSKVAKVLQFRTPTCTSCQGLRHLVHQLMYIL